MCYTIATLPFRLVEMPSPTTGFGWRLLQRWLEIWRSMVAMEDVSEVVDASICRAGPSSVLSQGREFLG